MAIGSFLWGQVAAATSVATTLLIAGVGALSAIPLTWWAKLARDAEVELTPSLHWSEPQVSAGYFSEDQPVMIQISYKLAEQYKREFQLLMRDLKRSRRSHGGYQWTLRYDIVNPLNVVETWHEPSWLNHLRYHERVSKADQQLQEKIQACLMPEVKPAVQHFVGDALVY